MRAYQSCEHRRSATTSVVSAVVASTTGPRDQQGPTNLIHPSRYFLPSPYSRSLLAMAVWETPSRLASWRVDGKAG